MEAVKRNLEGNLVKIMTYKGSAVTLFGLKSAAQHNGRVGLVIGELCEGRVCVELKVELQEDGQKQVLKVKPENLIIVCSFCFSPDDCACNLLEMSSILLVGCEKGELRVVKSVLNENPKVISMANREGWTPLLLASYNGRLRVVRYLLCRGARIEDALPSGETPLHLASMNNHCDVLEFLISRGANKETPNTSGDTPLDTACFNGSCGVVQLLLSAGVDKDTCHRALHGASQNGHVDVVKLLLSSGFDLAEVEGRGATALYMACQSGHLGIVELLVLPGVVDKSRKGTPLGIACLCGHLDVVRLLVSFGADVNEFTTKTLECGRSDGSTPLFAACYGGHLEVVRFLLSVHVDKDKRRANDVGATPLLVACEEGYTDIVRLLLSHGVDKEKPSKRGETPLFIACYKGHFEIVQLLFAEGANPTTTDRDFAGSLLFAACRRGNGHLETVGFLIKKGFDVNEARIDDEATPLHFACLQEATDVAKLLLFSGADKEKKTKFGRKALDMCPTEEMRAELENTIDLMFDGGVVMLQTQRRRKGRSCAYCDEKEGDGVGTIRGSPKFQLCASCRCVAYCSRSCQSLDWKKRHKKECKDLKSILSSVHR